MTYTEEQRKEVLKRAQETYGYKNQISVAIEECCELSQVLSKYGRYPNHDIAKEELTDKVIDEVADVLVCIRHLHMIFDLDPKVIDAQIDRKLARLERWMDASPDMYQTTKERNLDA